MKQKILTSVILALLLAWGIFSYRDWRNNRLRDQCFNRLRQLYCPMNCCVPLDKGLTNGAALDPKDVARCIKEGKIPRCPCGPEYEIIWVVGAPPPKCPFHGDLLGPISNVNGHERQGDFPRGKRVQSEPDIIMAKAIGPYRAKPYSELVKMVDAEPNAIDLKWSCSKAYHVAIWAMWENETNGNVCVIGMVNAKEDKDTLISHKRSFTKNSDNQFVGE